MNITLRQLEALVAVSRTGSMTRAAQELHITQAAVSLLLRQLELQLGLPMFDRTTRSCIPTAAGHDAVRAAERMLGDALSLTRQMRSLSEARSGTVVFVASAGAASALMPSVLATFRAAYPDVDVIMRDVASDQLVSALLASDAEFAIGSVDGPVPEVTLTPLVRGRLSAIGWPGCPIAAMQTLSWDELATLPTIAMRRDTLIRAQIDRRLGRDGKVLIPTHEVSLINTALSMTAKGIGYAILPSYMMPTDQYPGLIAFQLIRPAITRQLSWIQQTGRSLSPAALQFQKTTARVLASAHATAIARRATA
ncbi:DNA-binding transcriptional regulator, LysR family [Bradyrhizobium sp. NFR13]|uniref:LysR family transcriptional regulator n=1 Tax=Bradyrhizobium sp. NFR13 TaxID=1566285 RepID=UPI0008E76BD1|nr:LysR family transcriptional regulator [Bradyrhizobium sp. NFR13]SFL31228.1 DNA-binding transcriptional regulator, LysR family [Bradyrhizobium sp. NFR13]